MVLEAKFGQHLPLNRQSESLCPRGRGAQRLHPGRLGRHRGGGALAAARAHPGACPGRRAPARRRHHRAAAGPRQDGHGAAVDLCAGRPALCRARTACGGVLLLARPHRRASQTTSGELCTGILQADAYAGYGELYRAGRKPGPITEAACWAHFRRKVFELAEVARAPLAAEAVQRIDRVFDAERAVNGCPAADRLRTGRASWLRSSPTSMPGCWRPAAGCHATTTWPRRWTMP
jgi:transposase